MIARPSRRQFVQLGVGALAISAGPSDGQVVQPTHVYLHQTGNPQHHSFYLGALITKTPQRHREAIESLRAASSYRRMLEYKSTDKYKIDFCRRWIDYFVGAEDLRFVGGHIQLADWPDSPRKKDIVYTAAHKRLLELAKLSDDAQVRIMTINRGFRPRSLALFSELQTGLTWQVTVDWGHPLREPLLQIADFFTGSIQDRSSSKTKVLLLDHLREALRVPRLDQDSLKNSDKFRLRNILA